MRNFPRISTGILVAVAAISLIYGSVASGTAGYMNLAESLAHPSFSHFFGTDTLGRDIFKMLCTGGRTSLFIGFAATAVSTAIAVIYGSASAVSGMVADSLLMRFTEILMSIPQILIVVFLLAVLGEPTVFSVAVVIGLTGWMAVAKMVRSEVRQIRRAEFILSAKISGGGFFYILFNHFIPNFIPAVMFMIVTNIGAAIALEATLSFLGIGLPVENVSWGSLMSLSQNAMFSGAWWVLLIPGTVLVVTLICITNIGEYLRLLNSRERQI
jgi:peptide/nickel transport system permease protein